jgi:hypothetical protein
MDSMECTEEGCESEATFELHIPWTENEYVCAGHARVRSRQEGVVADALTSADDHMPDGAANRDS